MISSQMWEELNKFYLMVRDARKDESMLASPFEFFGKVQVWADRCWKAWQSRRCRAARPGTSAAWRCRSSGPTRPRGSST